QEVTTGGRPMRHQLRWNGLLAAALVLTLAAGCQKAGRYGTAPDKETPVDPDDEKPGVIEAHYGWREPHQKPARPIRFGTSDNARWANLRDFGNDQRDDPDPAKLAKIPFDLTPVGVHSALNAAVRSAADTDAVLIKVPLGLPDPTPHVPASNPLT